MAKIVEAIPIENYKLQLTFQDGVSGTVDVSDMLDGEAFQDWNDYQFFKKMTLDEELHTVVWPNGVDLSADTLYMEITKCGWDEVPQ